MLKSKVDFIKKSIPTAFALFSFLLTPAVVMAAPNGTYGLDDTAKKANYIDEAGKGDDVFTAVQKIVSTLLALVAIIFFILVVYAGIRWMTSRGSEEIVLEAKKTLESAVIGLVVITSSYALTTFIFGRLSGETYRDPSVLEQPCTDSPDRTTCESKADIGCYWNRAQSACEFRAPTDGGSSVVDSSGACLNVRSMAGGRFNVECTIETQSACSARGAGYTFYAGENQAFCDAEEASANGLGSSYSPPDQYQCCINPSGICSAAVSGDCPAGSNGYSSACSENSMAALCGSDESIPLGCLQYVDSGPCNADAGCRWDVNQCVYNSSGAGGANSSGGAAPTGGAPTGGTTPTGGASAGGSAPAGSASAGGTAPAAGSGPTCQDVGGYCSSASNCSEYNGQSATPGTRLSQYDDDCLLSFSPYCCQRPVLNTSCTDSGGYCSSASNCAEYNGQPATPGTRDSANDSGCQLSFSPYCCRR